MTITNVKYYYYRDQHRAPRVTLCRVRDDLGRYGYGWSICTDPSPHPGDRIQNDTLIRGGRSIARGRAEAALSVRRGIACYVKADQIICRLYWRPIRRLEALAVIRACPGAFGILACIKERDVLWFPKIMRPKISEEFSPAWRFASNEAVEAQIEFQKDVERRRARRLANAIRAGADANELARLEILGAVDDAGYLNTPTVYSEALERFVPESEAL